MYSGIYQIAAGMMQEAQRQELIASNIAGSHLPGFKGRHMVGASFEQALNEATEAQSGNGPVTDLAQGSIRQTGRILDFALIGDGFFGVQTLDGDPLLTRNGNFRLSADGALETVEGYLVEGEGGRVLKFDPTVDLSKIRVTEDGSIQIPGPEGERPLGRLNVQRLEQPERLARLSANYFALAEGQKPIPAEGVRVLNKALEGANLSPIREMAAMIQSVREFEAGHKMMRMLSDIGQQEQQKLTS